MTGTNNKLRFRNTKTLFNNTSNTRCEKLYPDKKEVSYAKSQNSETK